MGPDRVSLLVLLAAAAIGSTGVSARPADAPGPKPRGFSSEIVESLRASVQDRLSIARFSTFDQDHNRDNKQELSKEELTQFFNFPNFMNAYCYRGYWRNC
jgi:hypothetical protein